MDVETSENRPKRRILILGDGNFSYSLSYARMHAAAWNKKSSSELGPSSTSFQPRYRPRRFSTDSANTTLYATSYDSEETIKQDQIAWENVQALKEIKCVTVLHDVDATNLGKQFDSRIKFSKIIFNFPHVGSKSNIKACRSLLERFFQCIVDFVTEEGKVYVALCKGQGGTPIDTQRKGYGNTWQVVTQAASAGGTLSLKIIHQYKSLK